MRIQIILLLVLDSIENFNGLESVSKRCFAPVYCSTQQSSHPDWMQVYPPTSCQGLLESEWMQDIAVRLNISETTIIKRFNLELQQLEVKLFNRSCCSNNGSFEEALENFERELNAKWTESHRNQTLEVIQNSVDQLTETHMRDNKTLSLTLKNLENRTNDVSNRLSNTKDEIEAVNSSLISTNTSVWADIEELNGTLVKYSQNISEIEEDLAFLDDKVIKYSQNISEIEEDLAFLDDKVNNNSYEITHLYEKWIQLNVTGEQSNLRLNELSGNLTNLERKINLTDFQGILANAIKDIHQLNDSNKHVNDIVTSLQQITNSTADLHREEVNQIEQSIAGQMEQIVAIQNLTRELQTLFNSTNSTLVNSERDIRLIEETIASWINVTDIIQRRIVENEKNFSQQFTEIEQTFGLLYNLTNISVIAGSIAALETRFNDTSLELFTEIERIDESSKLQENISRELNSTIAMVLSKHDEALRGIITEHHSDILQLNQTFEDYRANFNELSLKESTDVENLTRSIRELSDNATHVLEVSSSIRSNIEKLQADLNATDNLHKSDNETLSSTLKYLENRTNDVSNRLSNTKDEIEAVNTSLISSNTSLWADIEELNEALIEYSQNISAIEEDLTFLDDKVYNNSYDVDNLTRFIWEFSDNVTHDLEVSSSFRSNIEKLNETLIKYSRNISQIEEHLVTLGDKVNNNSYECDSKIEEIMNRTEDLEQVVSQLPRYANQTNQTVCSADCSVKIEEIKNRTEDLEQVVSQLSRYANYTDQTADILQLNQTLDEYRADFDELSLKQSTDVENLTMAIRELSDNVTHDLENVSSSIRSNIEKLQADLNATDNLHKSDNETLSSTLKYLENRTNDVSNRLSNTENGIEAVNSSLISTNTSLWSDIEMISIKLEENVANITNLQEKYDGFDKKYDRLEGEINTTNDKHENDVENLTMAIRELSDNVTHDLENVSSSIRSNIEKLQADLNATDNLHKSDNETLSSTLKYLENRTNDVSNRLSNTENGIEAVNSSLISTNTSLWSDIEMISIKLEENVANITNLQEKYDGFDKKYDRLEGEINTTNDKHENDSTQTNQKLWQLETVVLKHQNETNNSIGEINSKIDSLEQTIEELSNNQTIGFAKLASNLMQFYRNFTLQLKEQANLTAAQLEVFENTLNLTYDDLLADKNCPDVLYNKKCYLPVILSGSLEELRARCVQRGGQPANVYNDEHLKLIVEQIRRVYLGNANYVDFNLGMTFNLTSGNVTSTNGLHVQVSSSDWKSNYPLPVQSFTGVVLRINRELETTNQYYLNIDPSTRSDGILCEIDV